MAAYSMDLRLRVLRDADAGLPSDELAEKYSVSRAWVDRLKQLWRPASKPAGEYAQHGAGADQRPDRTLANYRPSAPTLADTAGRSEHDPLMPRSGAPRRSIPRAR